LVEKCYNVDTLLALASSALRHATRHFTFDEILAVTICQSIYNQSITLLIDKRDIMRNTDED